MTYAAAGRIIRENQERRRTGRKPRTLVGNAISGESPRMKMLMTVLPEDAVICLSKDAPDTPIAKWYARENFRDADCRKLGHNCCMC